MSNAEDAYAAITAARSERDRTRARRSYEVAMVTAEQWQNGQPNQWEAAIFRSLLFAEVALEEALPEPRIRLYQKGLSLAENTWKNNKHPRVAEAHSLIAIDIFQDTLIDYDIRRKQACLHHSREMLDACLREHLEPNEIAQLLTRKSAILRHQAQLELTTDGAQKRIDESVACAIKAITVGQFPAAYLELGLAEWSRARYEKSDEKYVDWLRRAETHLQKTADHPEDNSRLALARFYRMNYRPLDACNSFPTNFDEIKSVRKILREAHIYGEAATQLWFANAPEALLKVKLVEARRLLELSLAAGNRNARTIVSLGFVAAILDGPDSGTSALADLADGPQRISWSEAMKLAATANDKQLSSLSFAMGIGNSQVWAALGTYASTFMNDMVLAETLYREAVQIDPRNAVALTNLARLLADKGTENDLLEAKRLIDKAQSFADRRFFWWREVRGDIQLQLHAIAANELPTAIKSSKVLPQGKIRNLKELPSRFDAIVALDSPQQRGYQLEILVYEAASLELEVANAPYRIQRIESLVQQVDGYFEHGVNKYRIECKWESNPCDKNDIILFHSKLDAAGVDGIFISMAGFTESAVTQARLVANQKAILLVDGGEIRQLFCLAFRMGYLITLKRMHFDMKTDVYFKIERAMEEMS